MFTSTARGPQRLEGDLGRRTTLRLVSQQAPSTSLRVFASGAQGFAAVLDRIDRARTSIEIRSFLWCDDDCGNTVGRALLRAADRGVRISIKKDRIGATYEYFGGNKQSFFHKRIDTTQRLQTWFLKIVYPSWGSLRQRPNSLVDALLAHPNVSVCHDRKTFDHAKLFIFDERCVVLGSMGIGDHHRGEWIDLMVEAEGERVISRLRDRVSGAVSFDSRRDFDFLVHNRASSPPGTCPMLYERLALIDRAEVSLSVEMAYIGDRRFTEAMVRAVQRGVDVKLVTGSRANVIGAQNLATCNELLRRTGAPHNLTISLHPRMVHSKVFVVDGRITDIGSANFTTLSHGIYDEVDLYVDDLEFARQVEEITDQHVREGRIVGSRIRYSRIYKHVERAIVAFQSRKSA
jgi:cardiolipin synthase